MKNTPILPDSAPFNAEQRAWINGYLAGIFAGGKIQAGPVSTAPAVALQPLTLLYGSQTGSSEALAQRIARLGPAKGFQAKVLSMADFAQLEWAKEERLLLVTSTYGDGDMPDNAQPFWDFLSSEQAPRLEQASYSVLALGDRNYSLFCEAGKKFDARLDALGAKRIHPRVDCDVEYETEAMMWTEAVFAALGGSAGVSNLIGGGPEKEAEETAGYSKKKPFPAKLKTGRMLSGEGSGKEVRHFEIVLEGSGLSYEAGDALGIVPSNCPDFVQEILDAAGLDGEEAVASAEGKETSLRQALVKTYDLKPFLTQLPTPGTKASDLVTPLRKLSPRLYSISSSPKAHPGEVHLTVGIVRYEIEGRSRKGVCSTFLADRVSEEGEVPVFIQVSHGFRPPVDGNKPMIMVGPGTGIAPFRAFLEERQATGAPGKNWLFFGDQKEATDFYYRDEFAAMRSAGMLQRLSTAFSRDQTEKIYVQNRMLEEGAELWKWLEEGAHFYVCGDASRMAKDVDNALHEICVLHGKLDPEQARSYVQKLKSDKRYQRDVY
jgi:sulfite reductase (NADPH) flavoprotein alpha-component